MLSNTIKNRIARINRQLAKRDEKVCTSTPREIIDLGVYHIMDTYHNAVVQLDVDLDELEASIKAEQTESIAA